MEGDCVEKNLISFNAKHNGLYLLVHCVIRIVATRVYIFKDAWSEGDEVKIFH